MASPIESLVETFADANREGREHHQIPIKMIPPGDPRIFRVLFKVTDGV